MGEAGFRTGADLYMPADTDSLIYKYSPDMAPCRVPPVDDNKLIGGLISELESDEFIRVSQCSPVVAPHNNQCFRKSLC
jgi:hypothetical protein